MAFPEVTVVFWHALVAMVAMQIIGHAWYGPLFGNAWRRYMKITPAMMKAAMRKGMGKAIAMGFVLSLIGSYVLAHFLAYADAVTFMDSVGVVFWLWLGFMFPLQAGKVLWEGRPFGMFLINTTYDFVAYTAAAYVLVLLA